MFGKKTVISTRFKSVFVASMVSMIGAYILILTDNVVAGQLIEDEAVAAMTLILPLSNFLLFVSYLIADGLVMMASYAQGKQDRAEVNRLFSLGIILAVVAGIFITVILVAFKTEILSLWEISPYLMNYAADYYAGLMFLPLIIFLDIFIYTIFIAEGLEKICVLSTSIAFVVNIVLDVVLCKLIGVMGVGLATLSGHCTILIVQIIYLLSGRSKLKFVWYFDVRKTLQGIFYSFYHSVDTLCLSILPVLLSSAVVEKFGEGNLISVSIAIQLLTLIFAIYTGLVDCLQPMVCQYHAERNLHSVKKTMVLCLKVTAAISLTMSLLGIIFDNFLPALFNVDDAVLADRAAEAMWYLLPFITFLGLTLTYANYYIYIERMNYGAFVKIILLLALPYLAMLVDVSTLNEFWFLIGASFAVAYVINFLVTKFYGRREGLLLMDEKVFERQLSYDLDATADELTAVMRTAAEDLRRLNVAENVRDKIISQIEKLGREIIDRNAGKIIQLEISILTDEGVTLIVRDNGETFSSGAENCVIVGINN